jgi:uncharacterized membrane protein YcaP (DUF421 family)
LAFVLVHRFLAWASFHSDFVGRLIKGESSSLYSEGALNEQNLRAARVSAKDLQESVRQKINQDNLENVKEIVQERNGEISVVKT